MSSLLLTETVNFGDTISDTYIPDLKISKSWIRSIVDWVKPLSFDKKYEFYNSIRTMMEWLTSVETDIITLTSEPPQNLLSKKGYLLYLRSLMRKIKDNKNLKDRIIKKGGKIIKRLDYPPTIMMVNNWIARIQSKWIVVCNLAIQAEKQLLEYSEFFEENVFIKDSVTKETAEL